MCDHSHSVTNICTRAWVIYKQRVKPLSKAGLICCRIVNWYYSEINWMKCETVRIMWRYTYYQVFTNILSLHWLDALIELSTITSRSFPLSLSANSDYIRIGFFFQHAPPYTYLLEFNLPCRCPTPSYHSQALPHSCIIYLHKVFLYTPRVIWWHEQALDYPVV